jgi:hypothetical protein
MNDNVKRIVNDGNGVLVMSRKEAGEAHKSGQASDGLRSQLLDQEPEKEGIEMSDHIPDLTKMISDTPRTEAEVNRPHGPLDGVVTVDADFAAQLERELNAANERIKRLEETLEAVTDKIDNAWGIYMKFKEAKP